jgi:hypothetical protein
MSLEVTGKLLVKSDAQQVSEKFKKREFVVELVEDINGNNYTNFGKFQLVQSKCEILDRFNVGDTVKVHFNIKGNSYVDKKDGVTKYITNLDAWRVEGVGAQQSAPQQAQPMQQPPTVDPAFEMPF